ncbi:unnamed protein product [Peronospora destructor]|uniref:Leo1-like protein n=1 Tax=Peronospora destructor TaxID=86335 RepID=A0AAV0VBV2_9STRA|nr:unnamed protein product [Peronospora destructor]
MASSPEAQSGSSNSSSEDEFELGGSSLKSSGDTTKTSKRADLDKLFSDDSGDDNNTEGNNTKTEVTSPKKEAGNAKDKEMEDLFGSDYDSEEEEFKASGVKESPARDGGHSNGDLFEDDAGDRTASGKGDGDNGYLDNMWLPRTSKASKAVKYFISKMPNILRLVPEPYTKEAIRAEMDNPSDETLYRNYVRWRYKRDPATGRVLLDETTKLPLRESNAKLVQWEDGTFSMFVGKEALTLSRQKLTNSFLFVNEMASQESVLECHARLNEKFTIRPMTTASKSHKSLTMSMRAKHNKSMQKMKEYISELDGEREQEQRVKITDEKLRLQNRKKARQGYEYDRERSSRMDAQFLEEGFDAMDYDRKNGARRPVPGGGFDEYRSSQRQRELERGVRDADRSESDNDAGLDEGENDEEEEDMVIHSNKKRRTVDEEDSE